MNKTSRTIFKLALTGSMVCAIGWGVLTFSGDPAQPTQTAEADITFMNFAPMSKHEKFVKTLRNQGFEKPRRYDWNGNKFYFTLKHTKKTPIEATRDLQRALKKSGVNKLAHLNAPGQLDMNMILDPKKMVKKSKAEREAYVNNLLNHKQRLDDFFGGGMVPFRMDKGHTTMAGVQLKKAPKNGDSLNMVTQIVKDIKNKRKLDDNISRLYNLEAFRSPGSRKTTMTAMWSQKNIDLNKFDKDKMTNHNKNIPTCNGCVRTMSFRAQKEEKGYANNVFMSKTLNPKEAHNYYQRALGSRGWKRADSTEFLRRAQKDGLMPKFGGSIESYAKGKKFITVMTHRSELDPKSTVIQVMESR